LEKQFNKGGFMDKISVVLKKKIKSLDYSLYRYVLKHNRQGDRMDTRQYAAGLTAIFSKTVNLPDRPSQYDHIDCGNEEDFVVDYVILPQFPSGSDVCPPIMAIQNITSESSPEHILKSYKRCDGWEKTSIPAEWTDHIEKNR